MFMFALTLVLFLLTIGVFILSFVVKRVEIQWLGFFVSICSIALTILDESITQEEMLVLVILAFFIMFMTGRKAFTNRY